MNRDRMVEVVKSEVEKINESDNTDLRIKALAFSIICVEILVGILHKQAMDKVDSAHNRITILCNHVHGLQNRRLQEIEDFIGLVRDETGKLVEHDDRH